FVVYVSFLAFVRSSTLSPYTTLFRSQKIERRRRDAVGDHSTEVDHDLLSPVPEVSLHVVIRLVLAKDDVEDACSSLPIVVGRQLGRHLAVSLIFVGEFGFEKINICQVGNV